jgi:hypothetical protein
MIKDDVLEVVVNFAAALKRGEGAAGWRGQ